MNLAGDRRVGPLDFHCLSRLYIDRLVLLIQLVPLGGLQLPNEQLALTLHGKVVKVNVALIVRSVFPDGVLVGIVNQELYTIDALAGNAVHLMNDDPGERRVGDGERSSPAVLNGEVVGGAVNLEALRRLDLHRIIVSGVQVYMDPALLIGGDSIHQSAVHAPDLESGIGDALALAALGYFNQLQTAGGSVIKFQGLSIPHLDLDGLGGCVEDIAVQRADLLGDDSHAGFQALNHDPAIFVRHILAIIGSQ